MQGVILAAGHGTRLQPLTLTRSKPMITIANKPSVEWLYDSLKRHAKEIIFVVRPDQKDIIAHFEGRAKFIYQEKPKGTGDALLRCEKEVSGRFMVVNSDIQTSKKDIKKIASSKEPCVSAFRAANPQEYGIFSAEGESATGIREKPKNPEGNLANAGLYVFEDSMFERLRRCRTSRRWEKELTDALSFPAKLHVIEKRCEITFPWDIIDANRFILEEYGSQVHPSADIRDGAFIEKNVAIGANATIGPNCFIRGYSSIGSGCRVGNAVEVKNCVVMENSFVSHLSYVGDSVIGSKCNIAAGTIFANLRLDGKTIGMKVNGTYVDSRRRKLGAIVADGVQFGVNCTVMPGKRIWPNLLIPPCTIIKKDLQKQPDLSSWKRVLA